MTAEINSREKPWQNNQYSSRGRLKVLFNNGYFSDLTISFPGKDIKYKAHKIVLAMSSSVFESMLFGPMAITGSELELPDDNPEAFKIILANCYDLLLEPTDIDIALQVYMLADKYFMTHFEEKCIRNIENKLNNKNVNKVLEFASNFNFDSLKEPCIKYLISCNASVFLQKDWLKKLLKLEIEIPQLVFEDSWKNPDKTLSEATVMQLLRSKNCNKTGLKVFSGCVSAKVISIIFWSNDADGIEEYNQLYISMNNLKQANGIISILDNIASSVWICIHLQCYVIPAGKLRRITRKPDIDNYHVNEVELFFSNVDDNGIDWVISAISSLKPKNGTFEAISFPRSGLTFKGLKNLMTELANVIIEESDEDKVYPHINVCSSKISSYQNKDIKRWIQSVPTLIDEDTEVKLFDKNEDIDGWHGPVRKRGVRENREFDNFPWSHEEEEEYY